MQAIIVQSFIAAPAEQVWAALRSRTDLLFDGLPADAWPEPVSEQPPYHLTAPWPHPAAAGAATDVSVTLHQVGQGVRVDVRHAGWGEGDAWDTAIQGHFAGWLQGMAALGLMLETGTDARDTRGGKRERYLVSGEIPAGPEAVYRSLTDPEVLPRWSGGVFGGATVAQAIENLFVRWTAGAAEITAILRPTPRGTHLAIAEYGRADGSASARWPAMFENLARFLR